MRHVISPSVVCPAVRYLSKLSKKRHDFFLGGGDVIERKNVSYAYWPVHLVIIEK